MCGLVGLISRRQTGFYAPDLDLFENMLILDQLRGRDSVGAFSVFKSKDQMVVKHATKHVTLLFETKQWKEFRSRVTANGMFVLGHNRFATRGAKDTNNAHPFVEGKIILAHNGTIFNQEKLSDKKVDVDSHAIAHALSTKPKEEVIPDINGAFALIWYDNEEERLYAVRNADRPLSLITTDGLYMLASEPWMAAMPYNRQPSRSDIKEVRELQPGELLSWNLRGEMTVGKLTLRSDKEEYAAWMARRTAGQAGTNQHYSEATSGTDDLVEDDLGNATPFVPGERTPPPEIRSLEKALVDAHIRKETRERASKDCALTQRGASELTNTMKESTQTPTDSTIQVETLTDQTSSTGRTTLNKSGVYELKQKALMRPILAELPDFPPGTPQLVNILTADREGEFVRWKGKIVTPDKPMVDAQGLLPYGLAPIDWCKYLDTQSRCRGTVRFCTNSTHGGPCIWISNVEVSTTTDVYGGEIPWMLWSRALIQGCDECGGRLFDWERPFTRVLSRASVAERRGSGIPLNRTHCTCPDCLMKVLPEGEIYESYTKRYYAAKAKRHAEGHPPTHRSLTVQNGESVSQTPVGKNGSVIVLPGPKTVQ